MVAHSGFNCFRKLLVRYEKLERSFLALNHLAAAIIAFRKALSAVNIIYGRVLKRQLHSASFHRQIVDTVRGGQRQRPFTSLSFVTCEIDLSSLIFQTPYQMRVNQQPVVSLQSTNLR